MARYKFIKSALEGLAGGKFDEKRRKILKGTAAAGALAALPKVAKMAMKPAADELSSVPLPVGPFHESPYFINLKKEFYDKAFDNIAGGQSWSTGSFTKTELDAIADQVSRRTGKSLEELGLSGLDEKELAQGLLRPEILKDVNTPQAVRYLEDRVVDMQGELEGEKISGFWDYAGYPQTAEMGVDEAVRSKMYSFYENKSLDDWAEGKITLNQIDDPDLIEYIKSLESHKMSPDDVIEYIGDSIDQIEEMSPSGTLAGDLSKTFNDTVRPSNWNKLHLVDREVEKKAWDETIQRQKDSEINRFDFERIFDGGL